MHLENFHLQQRKRLQGMASKALTSPARVDGFLFYRVGMNFWVGKPCHCMERKAKGPTGALRKHDSTHIVCFVNEACAPLWAETLVL